MKPYLVTICIGILICSACTPTPTPTQEESPPQATPTNTPLPEPAITPTATDAGFYDFTQAYQALQGGNDTPAFRLAVKPSQELADNHIGVWFEDYDRYYESDFVFDNGFKRMRIGALFGRSIQTGWPIREDTLMDEVDEKITEYADNGVGIILSASNGSGLSFPMDVFTQADIDTMLDYVTFLAEHFKGRIEYYEIYNEFGHTAMINTYVDLVAQSTARIKEIDPDAKVIMGAVPGDWLNGEPGYGEHQRFVVSTTHLYELIRATDFEAIPVDGISWHPLYDNIPLDPYYQDYPNIVREVQSRAQAKGFTGEYFVDEILWHTYDEPDYDNGPPVSKTISAKYYLRTITEHRGLDVNVTINTFFQVPVMDQIRNLNNVLAGAEPIDLDVSLETNDVIEYLRTYTFALPDGETLVAVWNNGEAEERDEGVNAVLTIPGFSAEDVVGINVFHGFEQGLVYEHVDSDLVIRDLLVRNYPVFIILNGSVP